MEFRFESLNFSSDLLLSNSNFYEVELNFNEKNPIPLNLILQTIIFLFLHQMLYIIEQLLVNVINVARQLFHSPEIKTTQKIA